MKALTGLVTVLSFPLMILNGLGGIASGVWLVVVRDWSAIGSGIFLFVVSTFLLGIALIPSLLLAGPAVAFAEKGKSLGVLFFGTLSSLYVSVVISLWCLMILVFYLKGATHVSYVPRLIWSYGLATGPWAYMASREQGAGGQGFGSGVSVFFAELGYLATMFGVAVFGMSLLQVVALFGSFMLLGVVTNVTLAITVQREAQV